MTIKICGLSYQILTKSSDEMQGNIGLANFNTQEISINETFSKQTQHVAKMHEVLHILSDSYNLQLSESQVKYLTHALVAFIEDNPSQQIFTPLSNV